MKKTLIPIIIIAGYILFAGPACQTVTSPGLGIVKDSLDAVLDQYVGEGYYPFLYARLENADGSVLYEHSAVNDKLLPDTKVDGQSWLRIWSMSKIVTISVVMDLVEDGILALDDPVAKYIPEFSVLQVAVNEDGINVSQVENREKACPIHFVPMDSVMTILHLINHQAGFYYATTGIECLDTPLNEKNLPTAENSQELVNRLAALPLIQQPGTKDFYGTNTTVLGIVAERATGKTLNQLVQERLTTPLNIEGLQYSRPEDATLIPSVSGQDGELRLAKPGELDIFGPDVPDYESTHELYLGGEGMLATADGYSDFLRMLLHGGELNGYRFMETSTIELITSPHTQKDSPWGYNGFNLWVTGDSLRIWGWGDKGLWQGGGYEGTQFWVDPKRKFVGVVMSQVYWIPPGGGSMYNDFRGAIYRQLWKDEKE